MLHFCPENPSYLYTETTSRVTSGGCSSLHTFKHSPAANHILMFTVGERDQTSRSHRYTRARALLSLSVIEQGNKMPEVGFRETEFRDS